MEAPPLDPWATELTGFICAVDRSGAPLDEEVCRARLAAIGDVGPDGSWLSFPHHWLAIGEVARLDCRKDPPIVLARSRDHCTLVGDLRLDNREQLLADLRRPGPHPSDEDLLIDAYLAWGTNCLERLIGEFSFTLWDDRERRLFAARDPMGDRTLYYAMIGNTLVLSNEIRVPRTWPGASCDVDEIAVSGALVRRGLFMRDPDRTFFRGVRQLPPGHLLVASQQTMRTEAYWSIEDVAASPLPAAPVAERQEEFRALFQAAVVSRLRTHRQIGSHLSGGLDSTSVACVAAKELARSGLPLYCFAHSTRAPIPDISPTRSVREERYVNAAADWCPNIKVSWAYGDERPLFGDIEAHFHYAGVVHPNHYQTWWDEISAYAAHAGVGTMLTGVSGNLTASWNGTVAKAKRRPTLRSTARQMLGPLVETFRPQETTLHPDVARRLKLRERLKSVADTLDRSPRAASLGRGMNGLYRSYAIGRFGIELRDPMGDRRIVEFCLRAPDELFQRHGEQRLLIRDSLRGLVPDIVLDRRSRQLQSADWVERTRTALPAIRRRLEELAACELAAEFIDLDRVRARMQRLPVDRGDMRALSRWNDDVLHPIAIGCFLAWVAKGCPAPARAPGGN